MIEADFMFYSEILQLCFVSVWSFISDHRVKNRVFTDAAEEEPLVCGRAALKIQMKWCGHVFMLNQRVLFLNLHACVCGCVGVWVRSHACWEVEKTATKELTATNHPHRQRYQKNHRGLMCGFISSHIPKLVRMCRQIYTYWLHTGYILVLVSYRSSFQSPD